MSQLGYGGAEGQTIELLKELRGTDWAPRRVICLSEDVTPYGAVVRDLGYDLSVIPRSRGFEVRRCVALRKQLLRDGIELIHAVNWLAAAYALVAAPRGARVVSSIRNSRMPTGRLRRLLFRQFLRRSSAILVNSECGRALVSNECRVPLDRIALVHNGIDVERVRLAGSSGLFRRELNIPDEAPLVAYVGRNARIKNIPRLLDVARRLLTEDSTLHVVIAGEGLDSRLVEGTALEGAARLHCLGARRDIPSLLRDASVLILMSDSEGMPNIVLEALAACVPVVTTAVGDLHEVVPRGGGELVAPVASELAAATRRVLSCRRSYQQTLELHADRLARTHSLGAMVTGTTAIWKRTVRGLPRPGDEFASSDKAVVER